MRVLSLLIALTCATAQAGLPGNMNVGGQGGHLNVPLSQLALNLPLTATGASECTGASIPGVTFTRSSSATCTKSDGTVVLLSSNQPRVSSTGLLVEGGATNLILQSEAIDNAAWSGAANGAAPATVTANADVAPDGNTTAERIVYPAVAAGQYSLRDQPFTVSVTTAYTGTAYIKKISGPDTGMWVWLQNQADASAVALTFCTLSTTAYTRCTVTGNIAVAGTYRLKLGNEQAKTGQTTSGITVAVWGAQVEQSAFQTSYIPTAGTSAARSADVASISQPAGLGDAAGCMAATVMVPPSLIAEARIIGTTGTRGWAFTGTGYKFDDGNNISTATASVAGQTRRIRVSWSGATATLSDDAGNTGTGTYDGGWLTTTLYLGSQNGASNFLSGSLANIQFGKTPGACN